MRRVRRLMLATTLVVVPSQEAWATGGGGGGGTTPPTLSATKWKAISTKWQNVCGGGCFATCVSVSLRRQDVGGYTAIEMTVTNQSGMNGTWAGTVFTAIGIANLPAPKTTAGWLTVKKGTTNYTSKWQTDDRAVSGYGLPQKVGGVQTKYGSNYAIGGGQTYVFTFFVPTVGTNYSNWKLAIHGQRGPNDCSTKLVVDWNGNANKPDGKDCGCCKPPPPPGVVPEPATVALLATGLLGMGGMGVVRRRRKTGDLDPLS